MNMMIFILIACLEAVSAFTCSEDSDTFYHADVSTECQMYHFCQNSQLQTLTCPSGEAFSHATSRCEDAATVNCIETMKDHSHHQHHHHHKRSAKELKQQKAVLENMFQVWRDKTRNVTASNFLINKFRGSISFNDLSDLSDMIIKYSIQYESWNSRRHASISSTYFLNRDMFKRDPSGTDLDVFQIKEILENIKPLKNIIIMLCMQGIDMRDNAFYSFMFDGMPMIKVPFLYAK